MRVDYLDGAPAAALAAELRGKYKLIWEIGSSTGLRISDILKLSCCHFGGERVTIKEQKTGKRRRVYWSAQLRRDVKKYISYEGLSGSDLLFPVSRQSVWKAFKQAAYRAALHTNIGTHTMRKSYGIAYMNKGHTLPELKEQYNHDFIGDTMNYITSNAALGLDERGNKKRKVRKELKK